MGLTAERRKLAQAKFADGGAALSESQLQPNQFRIRHLLVATTGFAAVFAIARLLGVPGTLGTLAFTYIFGPAIAFWLSRYGRTRMFRKRIFGLVLAGILGAASTVAAFLDSPASALAAVLTTAVVWAPQIAFIYFLQAAWKSGLRSAGIDPDAKLNLEQGD